jgi:hypothetical protein
MGKKKHKPIVEKESEDEVEETIVDDSDVEEDVNEESAESDSEIYKMKQKKESGKQKNLEFESDESKSKFINALSAILNSGNGDNPIMSQNSKYKKEFENAKKEFTETILRKKENHQIYNKDLLRPVLEKESIDKENKLKAIALEGVVALFKAVQKAKANEKAKDKSDEGYEALGALHKGFLKGNTYPKQSKDYKVKSQGDRDGKDMPAGKKAKWSALEEEDVVAEDE